ncbi:MAG: NADPH-dependent FMN reductase [Microthrixaceae bacterium]
MTQDPAPTLHIGAFSGSGRPDGWGARVLAAAGEASPERLELVELPVHLPHYDAEADRDESPAEVASLRSAVNGLDGLIIVSPEFNHSVPGVLKNALDWLSRPAYRSPLRDLPVTAIAFSPGPVGGARGLGQLRAVLTGTASALLPWPDLAVGNVAEKFDGDRLVDETVERRLAAQLEAFSHWVDAVSTYRAAMHA